MKIIVIGSSHYVRASTVKKLQREGHEVEAAFTLLSANAITDYRDAGYAGQYLRRLLLQLASHVREVWCQRRAWRRKLGSRF